MNCKKATLLFCLLAVISTVNAQIFFDESSSYNVKSIEGNATWETTPTSGDFQYNNNGISSANKAILYSTEAFQAEDGFVLNVDYTTGSLQSESHNLSFGLISDETDLSTYAGTNPFKNEPTLYSIGVNITEDGNTDFQGINFANGSSLSSLDQSGTRTQFLAGESTKITLEVSYGGYWCYRINGVYEASGVLAEGIDLTKNYRVAIYGQADNGGGKSIQSIELKKNYAAGERAEKSRGTWASVDHDALEQLKDFKTLDYLYVRFNTGASTSADHMIPHKLLERIALEGASGNDTAINLVTPTWGNLNLDEPEIDVVRDQMLAIKAAGFKVKAYVNSAQFSGDNGDSFVDFANRWFEWCFYPTKAKCCAPSFASFWDIQQI